MRVACVVGDNSVQLIIITVVVVFITMAAAATAN